MPLPGQVHQRVRRAEIDRHVVDTDAGDQVTANGGGLLYAVPAELDWGSLPEFDGGGAHAPAPPIGRSSCADPDRGVRLRASATLRRDGRAPLILRYTRPELAKIWSDRARFEAMRQVEVAACEELEGPTEQELEAIRAATFTVAAIAERERVTDHDTAAFVDVLAASAGPAGRWLHYGLTSSDVLDTALGLQLREVGELVLPDSRRLVEVLAARAREHVLTLTVGPHAWGARRADDVWHQAGLVCLRGGAQRAASRARVRPGCCGCDLWSRRHLRVGLSGL